MRRLRLNMYRAEDEMYIIRWHPQYDFLRGVRKIKSKAMTIVLDVQGSGNEKRNEEKN